MLKYQGDMAGRQAFIRANTRPVPVAGLVTAGAATAVSAAQSAAEDPLGQW